MLPVNWKIISSLKSRLRLPEVAQSHKVNNIEVTPFKRQRTEHPKVLFITINASIFSSIESVLRAAYEHDAFTVQTMIVTQQYINRKTCDFANLREKLIESDIPFQYFSKAAIVDYSPDVIFLTIPYSDMLPVEFWQAVEEIDAKIAYIPYGLEVGGGGFNTSYQFNLPLHNQAWRIFARSQNHRRMFSRYKQNGSANVVVTGSPRTDMYRTLNEVNSNALHKSINGRLAVLWTPHFSLTNEKNLNAWSSFFHLKDHILQIFKQRNATHFLIFRPHPLLWIQLVDNCGWTTQQVQELKNEILALENATIDSDPNYLAAFKESSAIIADCGSFLIEYLWVNKPIMYTCPPNGYGLNDDAYYIHNAVSTLGTDPLENLNKFVDNLSLKNDPLALKRQEAIRKIFYQPEQGSVGQEIINHVFRAIKNGDFYIPPMYVDQNSDSAHAYWQNSTNTYLAPKEYYDRQEQALIDILNDCGDMQSALDVGCGDGRYTFVIANHASNVTGIDVSHSLLSKASHAAEKKQLKNVSFINDNIRSIRHASRYDLVSCMGVLSGIIEEPMFNLVLSNLRALTKADKGLLILKDSLSSRHPKYVNLNNTSGEYISVYRNFEQYITAVCAHGFSFIKNIKLGEDKEKHLENHIFLFEYTLNNSYE